MSAHSPLRMSRLARRFVQGGRVLMSRKLSIARLAFRYFRVFCCEWGVRGCLNKLITLYCFPNLCFSSAAVSGEKKGWKQPMRGRRRSETCAVQTVKERRRLMNSGSSKSRVPVSARLSAAIWIISSSERRKSKMSKFSCMRSLRTVFGMAM